MSTRAKLEVIAKKFDLSGDTTVTLYSEYSGDCLHYLDDYHNEIFFESNLFEVIANLLLTFDFNDENEIFSQFLDEYSVDECPEMFSWVLSNSSSDDNVTDNTVYEYEEAITRLKKEGSLYDESKHISNYASPVMSHKELSEFILENYNELYEIIEWSLNQYDHKRGEATVYTTFNLTIDKVMNISDDVLEKWTSSVSTDFGMITID